MMTVAHAIQTKAFIVECPNYPAGILSKTLGKVTGQFAWLLRVLIALASRLGGKREDCSNGKSNRNEKRDRIIPNTLLRWSRANEGLTQAINQLFASGMQRLQLARILRAHAKIVEDELTDQPPA